mmetsp:Transcript_37037/g.110922  ORF Transcript_37037/g.110922 Transcript_37037/m.110922 type:complete len:85 (+) Transcript_37037:430-684(+)
MVAIKNNKALRGKNALRPEKCCIAGAISNSIFEYEQPENKNCTEIEYCCLAGGVQACNEGPQYHHDFPPPHFLTRMAITARIRP